MAARRCHYFKETDLELPPPSKCDTLGRFLTNLPDRQWQTEAETLGMVEGKSMDGGGLVSFILKN